MTAPTIALLDNDPFFFSAMHALLAVGNRTIRCRLWDVLDATRSAYDPI
jgi:hypothetical protein